MAIIGFRINHLTERSGKAARRVTQYLRREGAYAPTDVGYLLRTSSDTVDRGDFVTQASGNLPHWARGEAAVFFRAAEAYERGGPKRAGRWATTWEIALPKELSREEQWTMGTAFVATHLQGHAYLCVMHDPVTDGQHQPHLHVLFSERIHDARVSDPATYFRRPEVGGCPKERWFAQRSSVAALRSAWADWVNTTLEAHGHDARVHPGSLYDRGIDRKPEPKVGYSTDPDLHAERERIRTERDAAHEQAQAHAGWEARKAHLGLAEVHELEAALLLNDTYTRARAQEPGTWLLDVAAGHAVRRAMVEARTQTRLVEEQAEIARVLPVVERLAARQERQHGPRTRQHREERTAGSGYHVQLWEEEQAHGRDVSPSY